MLNQSIDGRPPVDTISVTGDKFGPSFFVDTELMEIVFLISYFYAPCEIQIECLDNEGG